MKDEPGAGPTGGPSLIRRVLPWLLAGAAGAVVLTLATNSLMTAFCAFAGVASGSAPDVPIVRFLVIGIACTLPAYLALILAKPRFLAKQPFLAPLFAAGLSGHAW